MSDCPWNVGALKEAINCALHEGLLGDVLQKIEHDYRIKRLHIAFGLLELLAVYLIFGPGAHFVCNFITFILPAWMFVKFIEEGRVKQDIAKWLTYWVIYNIFHIMEYLYLQGDPGMPFHWLLKSVFLLLCFIPPWNASEKLYHHHIQPFLEHSQEIVETNLAQAREAYAQKGPFRFYVWMSLAVLVYCHKSHSRIELLCNYVGFIYPAYASLTSMQSPESTGSSGWLAYWVLYSTVGIFEHIHEVIWIPLYWYAKFLVLLACLKSWSVNPDKSFEKLQLVISRWKLVSKATRSCSRWAHTYVSSETKKTDSSTPDIDEAEGKMLCKICLDKELEMTFVPCGHLACCSDCAEGLKSCPICRCFVESTVRTYMS